jgi:hypothetical protein
MKLHKSVSALITALAAITESFSMMSRRLKRPASLFAAILTAALSVVCIPRVAAQTVATDTTSGGFITFTLAPGASTAPITLPPNIPWHVSGEPYLGVAGLGEVDMMNGIGYLFWVGVNSAPLGTIASGASSTSGNDIVQIDSDGYVHLVTSGLNSFVVTNSSSNSFTETGVLTWTGFSDALSTSGNTGLGTNALYAQLTNSSYTGSFNTAAGYEAMNSNENGADNTAMGAFALESNQTSSGNSAFGNLALFQSTAADNTALGASALQGNTTGAYNSATGNSALYSNTTADYNTAAGYQALYKSNAVSNTASGYQALYADTSGEQNTATGVHALASNTSGSDNIAVGYHGGYNLTTGSNNIDIGSPGVAAESGVIRMGTITGTTSTQSAAYIAGIYGVKTATAGTAVFIDSSGQLGTVSSSIRCKEDIQPMAEASERLLKLRPVKFRYKKADALGEKPIQYGLIAEEVAKVYPELVVRDATTGRIDGVRYEELAPILLNEVQKQAAEIRALKEQRKHFATQSEVDDLKRQLQAALLKLRAQGDLVARR